MPLTSPSCTTSPNQAGCGLSKRIRTSFPLMRGQKWWQGLSHCRVQNWLATLTWSVYSKQVPFHILNASFSSHWKAQAVYIKIVIKVVFPHEYNVIIENVRPWIACSASARVPLKYSCSFLHREIQILFPWSTHYLLWLGVRSHLESQGQSMAGGHHVWFSSVKLHTGTWRKSFLSPKRKSVFTEWCWVILKN